MKKILLVILVIALAAPAVGFKDDDKTKTPILRMPSGGGYCNNHKEDCPTYVQGSPGHTHTYHFPCNEVGVMPPNVNLVEWKEGGECGYLEVTFDGGDFTLIQCHCGLW